MAASRGGRRSGSERTRVQDRVQGRAQDRIHDGLVGARALIGTPYLADARLRQQYATEIAPRTGAALAKILAEIAPGPAPGRPWWVLDLGAGTGAAGDAFRAHFGAGVEVVAVDRVAAPGVLCVDLEKTDVPPRVGGGFDFVVAAHLLNELHAHEPAAARLAARARKVDLWARRLLRDGGALIIVEPALRETSRELLAVRDQIVAAGLHVVAPCLWTGPCPALARERDWCHDTAVRAGAVGAAARVDFSYLVVRTEAAPVADPEAFRIVSAPLIEKGRLRFYGCGPAGRHPLVRLDRQHSATNAAFDDLQRGDVARIGPTEVAGDGLRVVQATVVRKQ